MDSIFLQDLPVDPCALVEAVGFLQTFLEALETMFGRAMLGLLWALDTDPDLLSEEPFLWTHTKVQNWEKSTQTCEPRIS